MKPTAQLVGLAVALLLTIGCEGAPSPNVKARSILDNSDIIVGEDADIVDVPYQISIESLRIHKCGGAIISTDWIVTAAHCIDPRVSGKTWFKRIRAGVNKSTPIIGWDGVIYQIADLKYHPRWDATTIDYDVGLIRVTSKIVFSDRIKSASMLPVFFGDGILHPDDVVRVTGWGVTRPGSTFTGWRLKVATVPLVLRERCSELFEEAPAGTAMITPRMLCGGSIGNGGPCQGDSGGPMIFQRYVIGVASWAVAGCNDPTHPTVFANLLNSEIRTFIKETTGI